MADDGPALASWKRTLSRQIGAIQTFGDFSTSKRHSAFANPGLRVANSLIPLPLTPRDAETIKTICKPAPFGGGEETVVDASVRKTWELNHDQFSLSNPAWNDFFDSLLKDTASSLGMLLLYEEGSFFKRHKDSEKVAGMIGTLVICLPSEHSGGDVYLSHGTSSRVFATGPASAFDLTALAWYSDVTHEIKEIKSGYRLVLTYNIIQRAGAAVSADAFSKQQTRLQSLLGDWHVKFPDTSNLLYVLEHKYSQSSLSLNHLKGRDGAVCRSLANLSLQNGFFLLLANLANTKKEEDDYYGCSYEDDASLTLDTVRACDGRELELASGIHVGLEDILGANPYKDRSADSEDEGDFTGNESAPATLRYHDAVAVLVRREHFYEFGGQSCENVSQMLRLICEDLEAHGDDISVRNSAITFMGKAVQSSMDGDGLRLITRWALELRQDHPYRAAVRASIVRKLTNDLVGEIACIINKSSQSKVWSHKEWGGYLDEFVRQHRYLTDLSSTLRGVETSLRADLQPSFRNWRALVELQQFSGKSSLVLQDHGFIMNLMILRSRDTDWILNQLIPTLCDRGERPLLHAILDTVLHKSPAALPTGHAIAEELLSTAQSKLKVVLCDIAASYYASEDSQEPAFKFINLLDKCFSCDLTTQATNLLNASCDNIVRSQRNVAQIGYADGTSVVKFLRALLVVMQKHRLPPLTTRYPNYDEYKELDSFLCDADQKVISFRKNQSIRCHIQYQLQLQAFTFHTETRGTPHTLIITKRGNEFEVDLQRYHAQLAKVEERLRPFRHGYVEQLLGEVLYREIVMLENVIDSEGSRLLASGTKRPAEDELVDPSFARPRLDGIPGSLRDPIELD
ncbi:uncharacterized protein BCR38DRAFT_482401 [Pseudomassariella vexata]|uniref:Uncharacterized protein n=1 Tax=Pseudomassariella vexata TaxID=1141098 RepID=A0A1Y2EBY3_9PEZI|nr:uncharacterized protein BCR38DRAFT_482401 [Pseudomassariella vexata]ORY68927.1 hypothetical protein BCR38DRAFT_482401 [Pseudomassariella vexata]